MVREHILFSGLNFTAGCVYRLSNQEELAGLCPVNFKDINNPWRKFVEKIWKEKGVSVENWSWKNSEKSVKQSSYFSTLLSTTRLNEENKLNLMAWMLSEMIDEIPEFILLSNDDDDGGGELSSCRPPEPSSGMAW